MSEYLRIYEPKPDNKYQTSESLFRVCVYSDEDLANRVAAVPAISRGRIATMSCTTSVDDLECEIAFAGALVCSRRLEMNAPRRRLFAGERQASCMGFEDQGGCRHAPRTRVLQGC